jgi:hypothetical protein
VDGSAGTLHLADGAGVRKVKGPDDLRGLRLEALRTASRGPESTQRPELINH